PELAATRDGLKLASVRPKTKIATANRNGFAAGTVHAGAVRPANFSFAAAVGAVNPIVQAPRQPIDSQLLIAFAETGQQHAPFIRDAIAVGVFEKPNIRRGGDEHATAP